MKAVPYRNSMFTGRIRMLEPGILAPSDSETPSFGCTVRISWLGCTPTEPFDWNARCGTGLSCRSEERRVGKECRSLCDWSSDVCSSDLQRDALVRLHREDQLVGLHSDGALRLERQVRHRLEL